MSYRELQTSVASIRHRYIEETHGVVFWLCKFSSVCGNCQLISRQWFLFAGMNQVEWTRLARKAWGIAFQMLINARWSWQRSCGRLACCQRPPTFFSHRCSMGDTHWRKQCTWHSLLAWGHQSTLQKFHAHAIAKTELAACVFTTQLCS